MSLNACPILANAGACNVEGCSYDHNIFVCVPCNVSLLSRVTHQQHLATRKHRQRVANNTTAAYRTALSESQRDRSGVKVVGATDFGIVEERDARSGRITLVLDIQLDQAAAADVIKLDSASFHRLNGQTAFNAIRLGERILTHNVPTQVMITLNTRGVGLFDDRLILVFENTQDRSRWIITRQVNVTIGNRALHEALEPNPTPYVRPDPLASEPVEDIVRGEGAPALRTISYIKPLPPARIPAGLARLLAGGEQEGAGLFEKVKARVPEQLNTETYANVFKTLLWVEEAQLTKDMERYDLKNVAISKVDRLYKITVPGLAEKRPSVLIGDAILARVDNDRHGRWYEGHVHTIQDLEIGVRFGRSFKHKPGPIYRIRFRVNRNPLRRMHLAMATELSRTHLLFPVAADATQLPDPTPTQATTNLQIVNPAILNNAEQLQAVVSVATRPVGSMPFVIFGPPGTGKTTTMVEAIRQVLATNPNATILACAPSNSAADNLAQSLTDLGADALFRLYAPSRPRHDVPAALIPFALLNGQNHFIVHPLPKMNTFKVIVSTCISAAILSSIGMEKDHFTHIFIDEAGQATEAEGAVSIRTLAGEKTNVVLSGDPKQLGPIIRSGIALRLGLGVSLLERLMASEVFDLGSGSGKTVVKLVQNYRSHAAIISVPNERFYNNDLVAAGDQGVINEYIGSHYLTNIANPKFPIVFHAIAGEDDRDAKSPSYFNMYEAIKVKETVEALLGEHRLPNTTPEDIGVISPYRAQAQKIRNLLGGLGQIAHGVKVASVEEYQGKEKRVVILSTVRSSRDLIEFDVRHTLGFIANPRRFNVAVTRAQSLLVVIGDPRVLSIDPLWRTFLNYVHNHGGWVGEPIAWDPQELVSEAGEYDRLVREEAQGDMEAFARQVGSMAMGGGAEGVGGNGGDDAPWVEME